MLAIDGYQYCMNEAKDGMTWGYEKAIPVQGGRTEGVPQSIEEAFGIPFSGCIALALAQANGGSGGSLE